MIDQAVCFGKSDSLVGVLTFPTARKKHTTTAVLFLNAGIVHRVGAGRVYVKLARALASAGFLTFRFDFSGIGDSSPRHDSLRFEKSAVAETQDAMEFLASTAGVSKFILLGGCSGAKVAFDTARCDSRIVGAILINFPSIDEVDGQENHDAVHRGRLFYYRRFALSNPKSWWRFVSGKANYRQLAKALWFVTKQLFASEQRDSPRTTSFRLDLQCLSERGIHLNFICSEGDHRLDDLRIAGGKDLRKLHAERKIAMDIIRGCDHTFSSLQDQDRLMKAVMMRAKMMSLRQYQFRACSSIPGAHVAFSHQL